MDSSVALTVLQEVSRIVVPVDRSVYESYEKLARERIERRDPDDWPVVAVALMLDISVWTEDQDFFGSGIPTWTTDRVELYLHGSGWARCHATATVMVENRSKLRTKSE